MRNIDGRVRYSVLAAALAVVLALTSPVAALACDLQELSAATQRLHEADQASLSVLGILALVLFAGAALSLFAGHWALRAVWLGGLAKALLTMGCIMLVYLAGSYWSVAMARHSDAFFYDGDRFGGLLLYTILALPLLSIMLLEALVRHLGWEISSGWYSFTAVATIFIGTPAALLLFSFTGWLFTALSGARDVPADLTFLTWWATALGTSALLTCLLARWQLRKRLRVLL
jgi:hypothetical protein